MIFIKKKKSPIVNNPKEVVKWALLSVIFWVPIEALNLFSENWIYSKYTPIVHLVDFTIIFTAVWMTHQLIQSYNLFKNFKLPFRFKFSKTFLVASMITGLICMWGPVISPYYLFWGNVGISNSYIRSY